MTTRITQSQVAPLRAKVLAGQGGKCALCQREPSTPVLDHDHFTGRIRGVLCRGCNAMLGHIENNRPRHGLLDDAVLGRMLAGVVTYLRLYRQHGADRPIHYTFRTAEEKKLLAKKRKAKKKEAPTP